MVARALGFIQLCVAPAERAICAANMNVEQFGAMEVLLQQYHGESLGPRVGSVISLSHFFPLLYIVAAVLSQ